jgi:Protein of unknown function (DUF4232)
MLTTPPAPPLTSGRTSGRSRGRHVVSLAVTAAAAAGLLAGCASASTHQAGTGSAASGTAGLALCQPSSLQVTVNASQAGGAAGSTYLPVDFTNTSGSPCGLYGYPGMSFVTAGNGSQIGAAAQQNPSFGKVPVKLAAGGVAHAWLQVAEAGNYPAATCLPVTAHWLRVYAPGETQALYVSHAFDACSSDSAPLLTVMPVRSGQGVQGTTP